jgi:hypothetical protein
VNHPARTPYGDLPPRALWKKAVNTRSMFDVADLWSPKFRITPKMPVVTYGSCFAQHIGRALQSRDFNWLNTEKGAGQTPQADRAFNYGVFSARTGSIYTTMLLLQWVRWASGAQTPPDAFCKQGDRFHDLFRPQIEPDGFATKADARRSQRTTIDAFATSIRKARVFVFTLGLTERWRHLVEGHEYPLCPGNVAGRFDPDVHGFDNLGFADTLESLWQAIEIMRGMNPKLQFILTVSPVPLTATMSGEHVITATTYSKSVLRAVCGELVQSLPHVDYFPAYEIISSPVFRATFYKPNQRDVVASGVDFVMRHFFDALQTSQPNGRRDDGALAPHHPAMNAEVVCEEALLARAAGLH